MKKLVILFSVFSVFCFWLMWLSADKVNIEQSVITQVAIVEDLGVMEPVEFVGFTDYVLPSPVISPVGSVDNPYPLFVAGSGGQKEIDDCVGAIDTTQIYDRSVLSEHSNCGGDLFPKSAGSYVQLSGMYEGLYRVEGLLARLNGYTQFVEDLPSSNADFIYQTCLGGASDMGFYILVKA